MLQGWIRKVYKFQNGLIFMGIFKFLSEGYRELDRGIVKLSNGVLDYVAERSNLFNETERKRGKLLDEVIKMNKDYSNSVESLEREKREIERNYGNLKSRSLMFGGQLSKLEKEKEGAVFLLGKMRVEKERAIERVYDLEEKLNERGDYTFRDMREVIGRRIRKGLKEIDKGYSELLNSKDKRLKIQEGQLAHKYEQLRTLLNGEHVTSLEILDQFLGSRIPWIYYSRSGKELHVTEATYDMFSVNEREEKKLEKEIGSESWETLVKYANEGTNAPVCVEVGTEKKIKVELRGFPYTGGLDERIGTLVLMKPAETSVWRKMTNKLRPKTGTEMLDLLFGEERNLREIKPA
jgi:hypothetical protein